MKAKTFFYRLYLLLFLILFPVSCQVWLKWQQKQEIFRVDLDAIRHRGRLIAITDYNASSYFVYNGNPMGFQYDMLRYYADYLGLELEILPVASTAEAFNKLNSGAGDLIAMNLTVTPERGEEISFVTPFAKTRQVLVQRNTKKSKINSLYYLHNRKIYVHDKSAYVSTLKMLKEKGIEVDVAETSDMEDEHLIRQVANGEIDFTVTDLNTAEVNGVIYKNLDFSLTLTEEQDLAWAVRKNTPSLGLSLDTWMQQFKQTTEFAVIYKKYYDPIKTEQRIRSKYWSISSRHISAYDHLIKKYSKEIGWDWRLVASLMFQESRFDARIVSKAGAFGLMQVMPQTARVVNVNANLSPEHNIKAGIRYIKWLDEKLAAMIENPNERIKFVLAAYNAGLGHVLDARRLAEKNGRDPNLWENCVNFYLLHKAKPEYYNDEAVLYGYCRGTEPYYFVSQILSRYRHYRNIFPE